MKRGIVIDAVDNITYYGINLCESTLKYLWNKKFQNI